MKLFVIGSDSEFSKDWSIWDEVKIIVAKDKESLLRFGIPDNAKITEIKMDKEQILVEMSEPDWGEDL